MTFQSSANNNALISRSTAREAFGKALRLYVGRGKRYSVKQLSNGTGIPDRIIECAIADPWGGDYRDPRLDAVLSLSAFLGPDFTTEWLSLAGQGAFELPDDEETPPGIVAADQSDDTAAITRCAADGCFGNDAATLRPVGLRLIARGHKLAAVKAA